MWIWSPDEVMRGGNPPITKKWLKCNTFHQAATMATPQQKQNNDCFITETCQNKSYIKICSFLVLGNIFFFPISFKKSITAVVYHLHAQLAGWLRASAALQNSSKKPFRVGSKPRRQANKAAVERCVLSCTLGRPQRPQRPNSAPEPGLTNPEQEVCVPGTL